MVACLHVWILLNFSFAYKLLICSVQFSTFSIKYPASSVFALFLVNRSCSFFEHRLWNLVCVVSPRSVLRLYTWLAFFCLSECLLLIFASHWVIARLSCDHTTSQAHWELICGTQASTLGFLRSSPSWLIRFGVSLLFLAYLLGLHVP